MSELEHRKLHQRLQQLQQQQHTISSPLLRQFDMQQRLASQEQHLSLQEEQRFIQQQRQLLLQQQQLQQIPPPFEFPASEATPKQDAFSLLAEASSATSEIAQRGKRGRQDSIGRIIEDRTGLKRTKKSGKKATSEDVKPDRDRKLSLDQKHYHPEDNKADDTNPKSNNKKMIKKFPSKVSAAKAVVGIHREQTGSENVGLSDHSHKKSTNHQLKKIQDEKKNGGAEGLQFINKSDITNFQSQDEVDAANGLRSILLDGNKSGVTEHQIGDSLDDTNSGFKENRDSGAAESDLDAKKAGIADLLLRLPTEGKMSSREILRSSASKEHTPGKEKPESDPKSLSPVPQLEEEMKDAESEKISDGRSEILGALDKQLSEHEKELFDHLMNHNPGREQMSLFQPEEDKGERTAAQCVNNENDDNGADSKREIAALI
eukprot:12189054-Ditylum_brightwellii.AAC.1